MVLNRYENEDPEREEDDWTVMHDPDNLCQECDGPWTVIVMRPGEATDSFYCRTCYNATQFRSDQG